ncbi:MAG: hypothetical protein H6718_10680 [Polyangiaceae bacterium]|nr:hypothetical protein [Myxococcales bacterium]MCB9585852.1 hypothetical protein [Polyangiaceae bacterium]MCB9607219.1 hypothetical protein [Polyangiaceae bacterium]
MSEGETTTTAGKRPLYLVLALAALSLVGMMVFLEGFQLINATTDPEFAARETAELQPVLAAVLKTQFETIAELHKIMTPMGVALVLLGGVLSIVSMRGIFGRASAGTILQVALVSGGAMVLNFVLSAPVRAAATAALGTISNPEAAQIAHFLPAIYGLKLALPLMTLALAVFGVTRRAAREALGAASDQVSEEQ